MLSGTFTGDFKAGTTLYFRYTDGWYAEDREIKTGSYAQLTSLAVSFGGVTTTINLVSGANGSISPSGVFFKHSIHRRQALLAQQHQMMVITLMVGIMVQPKLLKIIHKHLLVLI